MDSDVIIVGGGPAGSTAARLLAQKGVSTLLLDKAVYPRKKICAGGLLEHTFRTFPEVVPFIDCYNYAVRVVSPNLKTFFKVQSETPLMAMTKGRYLFDASMLELGQKEGAVVRENNKVTKVEINPSNATVFTENGDQLTCKIVIGADSAYSTVAKSLNIGIDYKNPNSMGLGIEKEFQSSKEEMDQFFTSSRCVSLYLHFGGMLGYGWVFPRESSFNVGIGGAISQGKNLYNAFFDLINHLKSIRAIPSEIDESSPEAALLPTTFPTKLCDSPHVILIGDAGGFCSSATGEGIYYSMMSGKLAAEACEKIIAANNFSQNGMDLFYQHWQKVMGNELKFQYFAFQKVLMNERRCRAAVNWASQDIPLRNIFTKFLTGQQTYKKLGYKMGWHYLRCKIRDKLGRFTNQ